MKKVKMKSGRFIELTQILDQIPSKDLQVVKDIKLNVSLVKELSDVNKELSDFVSDFNVKRNELLKPYQEEYKEKSEGLNEEEKQKLGKELDAKFAEANKDYFEETNKKITEMSEKEMEVEISDEKHAKLKEWFVKYGLSMNKRTFVEICDVLGIEE